MDYRVPGTRRDKQIIKSNWITIGQRVIQDLTINKQKKSRSGK